LAVGSLNYEGTQWSRNIRNQLPSDLAVYLGRTDNYPLGY